MYRVVSPVFLALIVATLAGGGCATTQLNTSWKDPSAGPRSFKKVVVLVLNTTPGERRAQEDEIVSHMKKTTGVPSYTMIPDAELADRPRVKEKIIQSGADGAVVLRLIEAREETTYVPGATSYWDAGTTGFAPYHYNPSHTVTNIIVRAEVSLYSVPDGKLLWAGASRTSNPEGARDLAMQVARAAGEELRKQGLLQ